VRLCILISERNGGDWGGGVKGAVNRKQINI